MKRFFWSVCFSTILCVGLSGILHAQSVPATLAASGSEMATDSGVPEVKVESRPVVLPSYGVGEPDLNPIFFTGRVYQGAQGHVYPYAMIDRLSDQVEDKEYRGVFLENEYLKICVVPELGGRILQAQDKTNGYDFFYRQHVVKPALIGMTGAWISGGVEWNVPHHHRSSSFMGVDWKTIENLNGGKSVWVGETELRHRMKWSVELTVDPGRSYVKARTRIENRSPMIQSMLFWANVSVHCNPDYEVIFAPNVQHGVDHAKVKFCDWPEGKPGVDFRFWKNHTDQFRSVFAWDFQSDFLAGYDHGREAGTVHVGNRHVVPGKKFFLWGNHERANMWDRMLTDPWTEEQKKGSLAGSDAEYPQYLELMVGAWSDNQPDYSWIHPGEVREHVHYWYPIRGIGGVKNATVDAAVNFERPKPDVVKIGFCASGAFPNAEALVFLKGERIFSKKISIDPGAPYLEEIAVPAESKDTDFQVVLTDAMGKSLVAFQPQDFEPEAEPEIVKPTPKPEEFETVEELFLAGQRIEQFHNARMNPMDYYSEALRRDSGDVRTNTALGLRLVREAKWSEAEERLKTALIRLEKNYTRVKDGEAHYVLGYVLEMQGKIQEATDQYWKATWTMGYQSAAFFRLAQLACRQKDYAQALDLIHRSLRMNVDQPKAQAVRAYLLRQLGQGRAATGILQMAALQNPLDVMAKVELAFNLGYFSELCDEIVAEALRADDMIRVQELIEVACDYAALGASEAFVILKEVTEKCGKPYSDSILTGYWLQALARTDEERAFAANLIANGSLDYAFPFRVEEIEVLKKAIETNPNDAKAWYLLGNLQYYLNQKEEGIGSWEESARLAPEFGRVWRNLGFAYAQRGEIDRAISAYREHCLKCDVSDPRPFTELDILEAQKLVPVEKRLALMEANLETILKHDDSTVRFVELLTQTGQYERAIEILDSRHFHVWEGGRAVHGTFVDAHLLRGIQRRDAKDFAGAEEDFAVAGTYPENLEVAKGPDGGQNAKILFFLGTAREAGGDLDGAKVAFEQSVAKENAARDIVSELTCFQIASLKKLGRLAEAEETTKKFSSAIESRMKQSGALDEFSKFGEDGAPKERVANLLYFQGLCAWANGDAQTAVKRFDDALTLNPNMIWPKVMR